MACVTAKDVTAALKALGIVFGDIVLVHSSLRSLGKIDGGAETVIRGFEDAIGEAGTLVMPTLCQKDFINCYKTWHMDKPSDVGYLTECFRKQPGTLRSDHPTHSVAARGKYAYAITCEHGKRGLHICPFGETAFSDDSPWLKMYDMGVKTVFLGVSSRYNTMKHPTEARFMEHILSQVEDEEIRQQLRLEVVTFGSWTGKEIWMNYDGNRMQARLEELGMVRHATCGDAELLCLDMKQSCDAAFEIIKAEPENWCNEATAAWLQRCRAHFRKE